MRLERLEKCNDCEKAGKDGDHDGCPVVLENGQMNLAARRNVRPYPGPEFIHLSLKEEKLSRCAELSHC
jgi:hypothetical protein